MPPARSVFGDPSEPGRHGRHYATSKHGDYESEWDGQGSSEGSDGGDRGRRGWKQRLVLGSLAAVMVVCLLGMAGAGYALYSWGRIERFSDIELDVVAKGDPVNYLIIGSDAREGLEGRRADSMVLFRVDPQDQRAHVLTIPRDLRVPLARDGEFDPSSTPQKINGAYASETGRSDLIETIRRNFGIPVHHYIEVNFEGFKKLIDQVGGVEIFVREPMHDKKSGFVVTDIGCVNLDGETALKFLRSRAIRFMEPDGEWGDPDGTADLGRGTRQQEFIRQAVGKALKDAPTNPNQLRELINNLSGTVGIDETISISDGLDLAQQFRNLNPQDPNSLQTLQLPVIEEGSGTAADPYLLWLDELPAQSILNVFRGAPLDDVSPNFIELSVLNGTGGDNEATNVAGALQEVGFKIVEVGDSEEQPQRTTLYHAPEEGSLALRVARHLEGGAIVQEDSGMSKGRVQLVTGPGLETIYEQPMAPEDLPDTSPGPADDPAGGAADGAGEADAGGSESAGTESTASDAGGAEETPAEQPQSTTTTTVHGTASGAAEQAC